MHVPEGADFGWRLKAGAAAVKPTPCCAVAAAKCHADAQARRASGTGLCIYNDTRFPENYRGLLFRPDARKGRSPRL